MRQPHEFAIHMGAGLNNGLTLKEIEEVLIQALPYVGYPAIATALTSCCRGYQGAWSGRRRKLRWPPRPAVILNGIRTAGVERRLTVQPRSNRLVNHDRYREVGFPPAIGWSLLARLSVLI